MNRFRRALLLAITTALVALAGPAVASATDYCVQTSCGGTNVNSIQEAFDLAKTQGDADRVFLGEGVYFSQSILGFVYNGSGPIEVIGAGRGKSVLMAPTGNAAVLTVKGGPGSSVHDLGIVLPQYAQGQGLLTSNVARQIDVYETAEQLHPREGVRLISGGTLEESEVRLARDGNATAVAFGAGGGTLRRSTASASTGVLSWYGDGLVEGARVTGSDFGVRAFANVTTIRSSWIHLISNKGTGIQADTKTASTIVDADGVTVTAPPVPDVVGVGATTALAPAQNAGVRLTNSIIRVGGASLSALSAGGGHAKVAAYYSNYDPSFNVTSPFNASITETNVYNVADPGFAGPGSGDFHLLPTSKLIDAGDPASPQGVDLDGNPLVADGNGDGIARRDLGAFELQPAPPVDGGGQPGDGQPSDGGPAADTTAPLVSTFRASPAVFTVARASTPVAARAARGTRLRYTMSEPAHVTVAIKRAVRRRGHIRYRTVGTLKRTGTSGANSIRFSGRIGKRALQAGHYRAVIRAIDAAGNRSAAKTVRLRITRA